MGLGRREVRRQVGHPRRGLGLAIHHDEVPAVASSELGVAGHPVPVRRQSTAGLRDVAQVRQRHRVETDPVEQVERVGDASQRGALPVPEEVPEAGVHDGQGRQDQTGPAQEVTVHDRQPVAVVQGQGRRGAVAGAKAEALDDRLGIGLQVRVRQPDQFR